MGLAGFRRQRFRTVPSASCKGAVAEGRSGFLVIPFPRPDWPGTGSEASVRCCDPGDRPSQGLEQGPEFPASSFGLGRRVESATMPQRRGQAGAGRASIRLRIRMLLSEAAIGPQPHREPAM